MLASVLIALVMCLVIQTGFFIFAWMQRSDRFTDLSYGLTFVFVSVLYWLMSPTRLVQSLVTVLVTLWGIRLAGYLYIRVMKLKRDARFDGIRENFKSFSKFWFFQGVAAWIILWPTLAILTYEKAMKIDVITIVGLVIWIAGFWIESIADIQKSGFRSNKLNQGRFVNTGLWKYAQFPNYFGEICMWWGILVISLPYLAGITWLAVLGPILITGLLVFVTGIPPLRKKHNQDYGHLPEYAEYKRTTSLLVPWFKK
jgi:steroid 5-alpha reductase family enzyme